MSNVMLTLVPYPSTFGPDVRPAHRDRLEYFTFRYGDSFWIQADNWFFKNHKTSKSPWQLSNLGPFQTLLNKREGVILDIGANIGMTGVQFAQWGYDVIAFEPIPGTANLLTHNLAINRVADKVTVYENAISSESSEVIMRDQFNYSGVSAISRKPKKNRGKSEYHNGYAFKLDDLALPRVAGIKIDIEGHELAALTGATNLLTRDRPVVLVELLAENASGTKKFNWSPQQVFDLFANLSYTAYNKKLIKQSVWHHVRHHSDYIFVPKESDPLTAAC